MWQSFKDDLTDLVRSATEDDNYDNEGDILTDAVDESFDSYQPCENASSENAAASDYRKTMEKQDGALAAKKAMLVVLWIRAVG